MGIDSSSYDSVAASADSNVIGRASDMLGVLWAQWWVIAACAAVSTVLAIALAYLLPIKYRAETLLLPVQMEGQMDSSLRGLGGLAGLVGLQLGAGDHSAEAQAILESKAFTIAFVRDHNLLPVLFPKLWDEQRKQWKTQDPEVVPVELDGYRLFRDSIRTVTQDRQTRLVQLAIEWRDPQVAARWANEMVVRVNEQMRKEALERARHNLEFLKKEYDATAIAAVRETTGRVMESELKSAMLASVQRDYAFRVIDPAIVPNRRFSPKRTLIAAVGVLVGLSIGVMVALLRDARQVRRRA